MSRLIALAQHQATREEKRLQALRHPIGRAIALEQYESTRRTLQARVLVLADGEPCRQLLADAAWVVGLGAELALLQGHAAARQVHATLRGVMQLAQEGARWKSHLALPLDQAVTVSHALLLAFADQAITLMPRAEWLRERVLLKAVDGTEVA